MYSHGGHRLAQMWPPGRLQVPLPCTGLILWALRLGLSSLPALQAPWPQPRLSSPGAPGSQGPPACSAGCRAPTPALWASALWAGPW